MLPLLETFVLADDPGEIARAVDAIHDSPDVGLALGILADEATKHRCLPRVLGLLESSGIDVAEIEVSKSTIKRVRLNRFLIDLDKAGETVRAVDLRDSLLAHRVLLEELVSELGAAHPGEFVVAYGLGLNLVYPDVSDRQSSDVDLYLSSDIDVDLFLNTLTTQFGFHTARGWDGRGAGRDLKGWHVSRRRGAHVVMVDGFVEGRPSAGHQWIPPFRIAGFFAKARSIDLPGGGAAQVPSPEHMMVMLAEKIQRKGDFSLRRAADATTIVRGEESIDWDEVIYTSRAAHVELGLHWLLAELLRADSDQHFEPIPTNLKLPTWERRLMDIMSGESGSSRRMQTRARATHRRLWVTRYIAGHPRSLLALVEIVGGRFAGPTTHGRRT